MYQYSASGSHWSGDQTAASGIQHPVPGIQHPVILSHSDERRNLFSVVRDTSLPRYDTKEQDSNRCIAFIPHLL